MSTVKARALVGFYRGERLVHPGEIVELGGNEFNELRGFNLVEPAPPEPPPPPPPLAAELPAKAKK